MASPDPGLDSQASVRSLLRIGGFIAIGLGVVLTGIAMLSFFSAFGSFGGRGPTNFWMGFVGVPLIGIGSAMLKAGYVGPATRYLAGEVTPTVRDTMGALGIGTGVALCPSCGGRNAADARFCDDCGAPMQRNCASCGATNAGDATYCKSCGAALPAAGP